jgi:hypothetical protein
MESVICKPKVNGTVRPRIGKPLVERELFVIGGKHSVSGRGEEVKHMVDLQTKALEMIAMARRCTAYFEDNMSRESAWIYNSMLERILNGEDLLTRIAALEKKKREYGYVRKFESMARIWKAGIPITHLPTEDSNGFLSSIVYLYRLPIVADMLGAWRDSRIFQNVCQFGHDKNIIFIGSEHRLRDFAEKEHDFRIWRIDFVEDTYNIVVGGSLPPVFEQWMRSFAAREGIVNVVRFDN